MNQIWGYFVSLFCYLGYALAVNIFCKKYFEISKIREIMSVILHFMGCIVIEIISGNGNVPYIAGALLYHMFTLGVVMLLFQAELEKKFFVVTILITMRVLVWNFVESFLSCLTLILLHLVKNKNEVVIDRLGNHLITGMTFFIGIFFIIFMSGHFTSVFYRIGNSCYLKKSAPLGMRTHVFGNYNFVNAFGTESFVCETFSCNKVRKWYMMLALPLVLIVLVIDMVNFAASNGILVRGGDSWNLYYNQLFSHSAICMITALSMGAAGFYLFGMDKIYVEKRKKEQYQSQIKFYELLQEQNKQMERVRHDRKNHVIAIRGLLENQEWDKAKSYLDRIVKVGELGNGEDITGNKVVDALLYQKRKWADEKKIIWSCDMQIPPKWDMEEFDLCVLLGNILDNALEACEKMNKQRECAVDIQSRIVKSCFLLVVKNSANIKDINETKMTSKDKPQKHGIGMRNIRDIVYKYNGILDKKVQNGFFEISVLLPLNCDVHGMK